MQNAYQNFSQFLPFNPLNHTQIWLAIASHPQKQVFVKQLISGFNPIQYAQFYQEYQVYQRLADLSGTQTHFFPQFLDFYVEQHSQFLVLAFYAGQTLKQLTAQNCLTFSQKITIFIQLCHAIQIFHSLGLIHCDIKPSNILIVGNQLKLLDFGLVKNPEASVKLANLTAGTPAYMSPEQFSGSIITYKSDYYSLGVVMFEMLVSKKPFNAQTVEHWAIYHCQSPIPTITQFKPTINLQLQPIFNQLLAKLPQNRPKNLAGIVEILEKLLKA